MVVIGCVIAWLISLPARAAFQENLWGARPAGLAGAFTALADDANAPIYNPAGITQIEHNELTIMYAQLFSGLTLYTGDQGETSNLSLGYFSFVPDVKRWNPHIGSFGISWSNFSATHLYQENTFTLTWAHQVPFLQIGRSEVFTGVNLNYLQHSFVLDSQTQGSVDPVFGNGNSASALGVDVGLLARPNWDILPGLKLGVDVKNVNQPDVGLASPDPVKREYRVGVAYQDDHMPYFTPTLDLSSQDNVTTAMGGWEGWFMKNTVGLRAGASSSEFGGGLSLQYPFLGMNLRLDYAIMMPFLVQGTNGSHRISLTVDF